MGLGIWSSLPGLLASHVRAEGEIVAAREQIDAGDLLYTIVPVE